MLKRSVQPELLDSLSGDDPEALRSRRDLRLINHLMGNERWMARQAGDGSIVELGAGSGDLTRKLLRTHQVTALDFQERPEGLECPWVKGDLFETLDGVPGRTVLANLILHHFSDVQLSELGELIRSRKKLVAVEPWRSRLALAEGYLMWPLINRVTRHDMMVSIRAGFRKGELEGLLGLGEGWSWRESVSLRGGLRIIAEKR